MKALLLMLLTFQVLAETCPEDTPSTLANTHCLFSKPLVIGASVSAGFGTTHGGPATLLSQDLNPHGVITNQAISGATSVQILNALKISKRPSVVLGFDLFFWDAVKNDCGPAFETTTREFFRRMQDRKIPMIIGKIPLGARFPAGVRLAGTRPCSSRINSLLQEVCLEENHCLIYDPRQCLDQMGSPVGPGGVSYFRDLLHTSDAGNRFCADDFKRRGSYRRLKCEH